MICSNPTMKFLILHPIMMPLAHTKLANINISH